MWACLDMHLNLVIEAKVSVSINQNVEKEFLFDEGIVWKICLLREAKLKD